MINTFQKYNDHSGNEILVFKKDPDENEAPFDFNLSNNKITFKNEIDFDKESLLNEVRDFKPNVIICSGWGNKKYIGVVKKCYKSIPCILTMDNQWHGTLKQYLGRLYTKLYLKNLFVKIWVPGDAQVNFAKKLGFSEKNIIKGWYVANHNFLKNLSDINFNKRFVFVGRYVNHKGIIDLVNSFIKLKSNSKNDWELHCYGTGDLLGKLPQHKDITHHGFIQPDHLFEEAKKGGVFVLPSHFEPWGLVVQEFALAGYPLVVSDKVGAAKQFVKSDNGIIFKAENENSLLSALKSICSKSNDNLLNMAKKSQIYGKQVNLIDWENNLNQIIYSSNK